MGAVRLHCFVNLVLFLGSHNKAAIVGRGELWSAARQEIYKNKVLPEHLPFKWLVKWFANMN